MQFPANIVGAPLLRSYICERYELRITRRCLEEDLDRPYDSEFETLLSKSAHEIVKAFVKKRRDDPADRSEVAPLTCGRRVYRLAYGHDHRGATWYDEEHEVVWLLAYRLHRSGQPGDAYPYFKSLDTEGRFLPDEGDYQALFDDRGLRAAHVVVEEAQQLLEEARRALGTEVRGVLGAEAGVGVIVEVVETLEETSIALRPVEVPAGWVTLIPVWFFPQSSFEDWETSSAFPTRKLARDEICFRYLHER